MSAGVEAYRKPYLDSSVLIGWLKRERIGDVDRGAIGDHLLRAAERGDYVITISALTFAEVHKVPRSGAAALSANEDERILAFLENDYFEVVPLDRQIGEEANRLCRSHSLHPNDAIHLASALRARCDVLLAWDRPLVRAQHPQIRIEEPRILGQSEIKFES